jgi:hypothetical protein
MEQLDYNLLFRWFVGLSADDPVWDATVFCKNRDRLAGNIGGRVRIGLGEGESESESKIKGTAPPAGSG